MGHSAVRSHFHAQSTLGSDGNLVFGGLAIDEKAAVQRSLIGDPGSQAVTLFAYKKKHSYGSAFSAQTLAGGNLCRHNTFRVAGAASIDVFAVFRSGNERWNRINVGGEDDLRRLVLECGLHVEAAMGHRKFMDGIVQPVQLVIESSAYGSLVS